MTTKKMSESRVTVIRRPLPMDGNWAGNLYGGNLMRHMDEVGAICALRHARGPLVTAAVERMEFAAPVHAGDILICHAQVNLVATTSMEVGIRIEAEDWTSGETRHAGTCYLTFVGVDENGKPRPLPQAEPETDEDRRRMADAARRMALSRLARRQSGGRSLYLRLHLLAQRFAVCRLPKDAALPELPADALRSLTRADDGITLILTQEAAPLAAQVPGAEVRDNYACFHVAGSTGMRMVGRFASLTTILAAAGIPIFALSTFGSDYFLVEPDLVEKTVSVLSAAGHSVKDAGRK
jgi:acyl-CoA hydrolase